ncbi:nucleotide exchange factor GrpE [Schaalia vaccimaxillae]|uniref:nucleotide exchange factor GrpE n=1 Tax=Schaalia vaccimaxillae TaxID=183916 RepID=UPI0003B6BB2C|nr:nucleotide exchange factor GrpE [Schaalia vaccimaxillae]
MTDAENQGFEPEPDEGNLPDEGEAGADSTESTPAVPADTESADGLDMSAFEEQVEDSDLAKALERIAEVEDQLARANADLYNLNQEYANYVRRSKESVPAHRDSGQTEVIEALIGVLDDIDAARAHGDLEDGPFAAIATKLEDALATRFSLERYGQAGEDFDPQLHEALMAQTNEEVDHPVIAQILQPGYKRGEKILRAAKVMVDNPA